MRRALPLVAIGALLGVTSGGSTTLDGAAPRLLDLRVTNGATPFQGDRRLLATVSPNGDGFRDAAVVRFRLAERARVTIEAIRTDTIRVGRPADQVVWRTRHALGPGEHRLRWKPTASTPPRTYILRLTVVGEAGTRVYGAYRPSERTRVDAPVVRVQGIDAGFPLRSYAPGERATLSLATDAQALQLQVYAYSTTVRRGEQDFKTSGVAMTPPLRVDWRGHRSRPGRLRLVRAGNWPSGLYFLRAGAPGRRVGYAPFIVRPKRLGTRRVAVVLSTNTWQAYNFHDAGGDGWGDSWYVSERIKSIDLRRPYLDFGVPFRFRDWDLTFIAWLNRTGKQVEFLSDDDLERVATGDRLARTYDLVVFPGHEEYVTDRAFDIVERYRNLGGNLMFLSANNFFWNVRREGHRLVRVKRWRMLRRPEAALVGVQYVGSNHGGRQEPYLVTAAGAVPWAFSGTGLRDGDAFGGRYGIEIDARTAASPMGTRVLATIPELMGNRSAEMTYYETRSGAKVFAAGTLNFAASLDRTDVSQLLENVWARLSAP
ncbi:MAG: hypothetical protein H0U03_01585 [Actinobacteria bacterium]|nr:hypothetical protein [Actinomycetota bacterium]